MHLSRRALLSTSLALLTSCPRAQAPDLEGLSPARSPALAEAYGLAVAILFASPASAQLVVFRGGVEEARSPLFEFPMQSIYGAAWVENVRVLSPSRFLVAIRLRQNCGPSTHDYTFSRSKGNWVLVQLNREERECSENGSVTAWRATFDHIARTARTTTFRNAKPQKDVVSAKQLKLTQLAEFHALDPLHEGDA
jgi:hypothetical protein